MKALGNKVLKREEKRRERTADGAQIAIIGHTETLEARIIYVVDEYDNVDRVPEWVLVRVPVIAHFWAPVQKDGTVDVDLDQ